MSCSPSCSIRLNSLESIWYCNLAVIITVFLVFDGHRRHNDYASMPWPDDQRPDAELKLYLLLISAAIILISIFIPTQYFKVGNHANDQSKLGTRRKRRQKNTKDCSGGCCDGVRKAQAKETPPRAAPDEKASIASIVRFVIQSIQSCRKHLGPIGATIHITSAFCLLLPVLFLQARAIQAGLFPPDMIWRSEVGNIGLFLFQDPPNISAEHSQSIRSDELSSTTTLGDTDSSLSEVTPSIGPEALQAMDNLVEPFNTVVVTVNFLNYVVPLFIYAIRYADVFWDCHKGFALLISLQLMMNAIQYALGFIGMSLLYKLHWYGWDNYDIDQRPVFSSGPSLIPAYLINNITVFVAAAVLYMYGYGRLKRIERKRSNNASSAEGAQREKLMGLKFSSLPQIAAMCALIVFISCKTPFIIEYMAVYRFSGDGRMLCCVVFDCLYIIVWFVLWIFLSIKRHWEFAHVPEDDLDLYEEEKLRSNSSERLEPLLLSSACSNEYEMATNCCNDRSLEFQLRDGKNMPFSNINGNLNMIYVRNGKRIDKYKRIIDDANGVDDDGGQSHPASDSCRVEDVQENVAVDSDVNILSNPLSTT